MNFLKKIIFCSAFSSVGLLANMTTVSASKDTARVKGFNVGTDFQYVADKSYSASLDGSKWHYGNMNLWVSMYTYRPKGENYKRYYIMVEAINSSNTQKLKNGYYKMVNKEMQIDVSISNKNEYSDVSLIKYSPEEYGTPKIVESTSTSYTVTASFPPSVSATVTYSVDVYKNLVYLVPSTTSTGVSMKYVFEKTGKSSYNSRPPLNGDCIQRCVFTYEMNDYSSWKEEDLEFNISFTGKIRKYACLAWGNDGCETETETITTYCRPSMLNDAFNQDSYYD